MPSVEAAGMTFEGGACDRQTQDGGSFDPNVQIAHIRLSFAFANTWWKWKQDGQVHNRMLVFPPDTACR